MTRLDWAVLFAIWVGWVIGAGPSWPPRDRFLLMVAASFLFIILAEATK